MRFGGRFALIVVVALSVSPIATAWADDALSPADYQWLGANLNVAAESLTLQGLTPSEKAHVHLLINRTRIADDKRLMEVADYLYRVNSEDFQKTLNESER